ncbi:MAG: hypothetical protein K0Q76_4232 [Panacagrimonas sp.]|nr:DUF4124 domain-containing protein [Panacagrimonas sp.]MCC2659124.1 hypothetical protein [Panacagrimonas sp.]
MRGLPRPVVALALLAMLSVYEAAARSVYRWVDKNGVVHYDDTQSAGQKMTREHFDDRDIPEQPEWTGVIPRGLIVEVQQRCDNSRERLMNYRGAPVIYGRDPSGNVYQLSPSQSRLMLTEIQGEIDRYCAEDAPRRVYAERIADAKAEAARRSQLKAERLRRAERAAATAAAAAAAGR